MASESIHPISELSKLALVPEHSIHFMEAMSGGSAFLQDGFLFLHAGDWLMGIGYPLKKEDDIPCNRDFFLSMEKNFDASSFEKAMEKAILKTGAKVYWAVAPGFTETLKGQKQKKDAYYILFTDASPPQILKRSLKKAEEKLSVTESSDFTAAHRALWAEFLERTDMEANVRNLYAGTEAVLSRTKAGGSSADLRLLNAWDASGNLAASLLLDYSADDFCTYIIGAHSKRHYTPHATDLLFARLLENAGKEGKKYLHLGLGVNEGIRRFKEKWGAKPLLSYEFLAFDPGSRSMTASGEEKLFDSAMQVFLAPSEGLSKRQIFESFPPQRSFAMAWEIRKGNAISYLCGTAHFFCFSFSLSFSRMFEPLHTVIFEGPLDENALAFVEKSGRNPGVDEKRVISALSEDEIRAIERVVYGPQGRLARILGREQPQRVDVRALLSETRPWFAFFALWAAFLERSGWSESVDLEACRVAREMGKTVIPMETLEEQLASLESIPFDRITRFLKNCGTWQERMKRNAAAYIAGDLERLLGSSVEFPSRTEQVIDDRDERFRQRMRPFLEEGNCAVFVGSAHLLGLRKMLVEDGFRLRQVIPGFRSLFRRKEVF